MPYRLTIRHMGQIRKADLTFGDLTVLVGPQAGGKSIALQWLKLVLDTGQIQAQLARYGLDWSRQLSKFLDLYFGEGMRSVWREGSSEVKWNNYVWNAKQKTARMGRDKTESLFLVPAQRVLTLRDGWPRPFSDFSAGDPFAVRAFSEKLRLLMEQELGRGDAVFPKSNRLKAEYRKLLERAVFGPFRLTVDSVRSQKRLVLGLEDGRDLLPYMVWSAGQREFVPLLLGLYWLMPPAKVSRRANIDWVVIEEPEAGLHPRAISIVLLLVLELLERGYRVCISTHSPQILDLVWVLRVLREAGGSPEQLLRVFDVPRTAGLTRVVTSAMDKECRVYFFDADGGIVHDITELDPSSLDASESTWGGLLDFSERANEAVSNAVARQPSLFEL
ncbi:MAG: ATP-binding protein [Phycisphaerales bacterium]|nr:MAG: ATP-binding protein [Phycisphaerales bacterium]